MNRLNIMVGCALFAMAAPADEENPVIEEGRIELLTSFTTVSDVQYYARTCAHRTNGTFSARVSADPRLREEWRIDEGQPTYVWLGIGGVASGKGNSTLSVNLNGVGSSYDVVAIATWALTKDNGSTAKTMASKSMTFDAIKYDFRTLPPGIDGLGANQLVDSQEATLQVTATGCTQTDLLSLSPKSKPKPAPGVRPQNEVNNTEMFFVSRDNPLLWKIPCPYWYGGSPTSNPPACCYSNAAKYELSLNPDGCNEHRLEVSAHLPSADLESGMLTLVNLVKSAKVEISRQEALIDESDEPFTRVWLSFTDYVMPEAGVTTAAKSQYKGKIMQEEQIHRKQFLREEGYGFEDLYSLPDALASVTPSLKILKGKIYFDCKNEQCIKLKIQDIRNEIRREQKISDAYWVYNRGFSEYSAKNEVKYREAYLYHCTYEESLPSGSEMKKDKDSFRSSDSPSEQ